MKAVHALVALVLGTFVVTAPPRPAPPTVVGPRTTTLEQPVFTFKAKRATAFRCSFDSAVLHRCAKRYSERLLPGTHVLRVRSVGRRHTLSRLVSVRILVRFPVPELVADQTTIVGEGAGVPATNAGTAYVPVTSSGTLVVVRDGSVVSRATVGVPATSIGLLDTAVADERSATQRAVWTASDEGARITGINSNGTTTRFDVAPRPGGLAASERAVWAFHFLTSTITRIDLRTMTASRLDVAGAQATGIAVQAGSLWLLTTNPSRVLELDPDTGALKRTIALMPPFALRRALIGTWWLAAGSGAVWATLPNNGAVARVDTTTGAVQYFRTPYGQPFGIAVGAGSAWVATDRAVLQLDETTGALRGAVLVPPPTRTAFVSIAYGYGAAWFTSYDRGTVTRIRAPGTPPTRASSARK